MAIKGCVERIAQSLLSPKERLNPLLFDENDVMHEEVRKSLLEFAQTYIDNIYGKFENTVIKDISLAGSQASYFYHDNSDIDLVIDIQGENNGYLNEDYRRYFHKYIGNIASEWLPDDLQSKWRGISVEVSPDRFKHKYSPQYSLLHNRWIFKFDNSLLDNITVQAVADAYYNKLTEIAQTLHGIIAKKTSAKEKNEALYGYYKSLIFDIRNDTYLVNIVYKILRSQHQIQGLGLMIALNNLQRINNLTTGNRRAATETPEDTAQRLLSPQDRLSPLLFDNEAHIHEDLQKKLIDAAKIVFEHTAGKFDGAVIKDICLIGSMASYSYRADSDIDIAVIVDFDKCPYIDLRNKVRAFDFLTEIYAAAVDVLPQFRIGGKTVDITLKTDFTLERYSLLQNKWLKEPVRGGFARISATELAVRFYEELEKHALFMKQFKITDGHYTVSDCQKIRDRLIRQMNSDNDNAPDVHLVYTLLSQQGLIKLFGSNMNDSLNFALSLTGKPAGT